MHIVHTSEDEMTIVKTMGIVVSQFPRNQNLKINAMYVTGFIQCDKCTHTRICGYLDLDQSLATEHALADLADDVLAVLLAHQDDTTTTLAHTAKTTESVDEIDGGVWDMV